MTTMRDKRRVVGLRSAEHGWEKPLGYRLLGWLRWEYEYVLAEETRTVVTWSIPKWAQSPTAGIIGTWHARRRRLCLKWGVPLWFFRPVSTLL